MISKSYDIVRNSISKDSDTGEKLEQNVLKPKKKKRMHSLKKSFVPSIVASTGSLPSPPINTEPELIHYFYSIFHRFCTDIVLDLTPKTKTAF